MKGETAAPEMRKKNANKLDAQKLERIIHLLGAFLSFIVAFGLTFNPYWQLTILAGILGGAFYMKLRRGALVGAVSVCLAWSLFVLISALKTNALTLIKQFTGILLGNEELSWLIILIILLVGALLGALSGVIGSGIRMLIQAHISAKKELQSAAMEKKILNPKGKIENY